jgi:hypothetical protein
MNTTTRITSEQPDYLIEMWFPGNGFYKTALDGNKERVLCIIKDAREFLDKMEDEILDVVLEYGEEE